MRRLPDQDRLKPIHHQDPVTPQVLIIPTAIQVELKEVHLVRLPGQGVDSIDNVNFIFITQIRWYDHILPPYFILYRTDSVLINTVGYDKCCLKHLMESE